MKCPDIESLISYALSPEGCDDVAKHILECAECKNKLEIIHETMLSDRWTNPSKSSKSDKRAESVDDKADVNAHGNTVKKFVHTATRDMRDRFGIISIPAGGEYLKDPFTGECELATGDAINLFQSNGGSFYSPGYDAHIRRAVASAEKFMCEIELNMNDMKGRLIPNCNLPWKQDIKPWALTFQTVVKHELAPQDVDRWMNKLENNGVIPACNKRTRWMNDSIRATNRICAYDIGRKGIVFRVFVAFVTSVTATMAVKSADTDAVECIKTFAKDWERRKGVGKACCMCFALCAADGWDLNVQPNISSDTATVYSCPAGNNKTGWNILYPKMDGLRRVYQDLILSLCPISVSSARALMEKWMYDRRYRSDNHFSVSDIGSEFGIPESRVRDVFEELRNDKSQSWCADIDGMNIYWNDKGVKGAHFVYKTGRWMERITVFLVAIVTATGVTVGAIFKEVRSNFENLDGKNINATTWNLIVESIRTEISSWETWFVFFVVLTMIWFFIELIRNKLRRRLYN